MSNTQESVQLSRRDFFHWSVSGLGSVAAASLLWRQGLLEAATPREEPAPGAPLAPHHAPKAKRVIHLCLCGGLSHVDSFDYKPKLFQMHGKSLLSEEK